MYFRLLPAISTRVGLINLTVHEGTYMMLLASCILKYCRPSLGLVGPYEQPYSKTLSLNRATFYFFKWIMRFFLNCAIRCDLRSIVQNCTIAQYQKAWLTQEILHQECKASIQQEWRSCHLLLWWQEVISTVRTHGSMWNCMYQELTICQKEPVGVNNE